MTSQVSLFDEQESKISPSYRGGSLASLTALRESVRHLLMNVICGRSTGESFAKLLPSGSWARMSQDCFQASLDGSLEEYSETWPKWGMMLDGVAYAPHGLEPFINEREYSLLPTPTASDAKGSPRGRFRGTQSWTPSNLREVFRECQTDGEYPHPEFVEWMMGFDTGYTDLNL